MPYFNPYIGNFSDADPSPPLQPFAGKNPHFGVGKKGKGKGGFKGGGGGGSIDPTWLSGLDTPTINGANVLTANDAYATVYSDVLTLNTATETGKFYLEFLVEATIDNAANPGCGLINATYKTNSNLYFSSGQGLGVAWSSSSFQVMRAMDGVTSTAFNNLSQPTAGQVIGIAIDYTANKIWAHVDGTWGTDAGVGGGVPDVGNGWAISGSSVGHLNCGSANLGGATTQSWTYQNSGLYIPSGYTMLEP